MVTQLVLLARALNAAQMDSLKSTLKVKKMEVNKMLLKTSLRKLSKTTGKLRLMDQLKPKKDLILNWNQWNLSFSWKPMKMFLSMISQLLPLLWKLTPEVVLTILPWAPIWVLELVTDPIGLMTIQKFITAPSCG